MSISEENDVGPRDTQEYQVAMALEFWRKQQEEHFKQELSSKENERMKVLAAEWKQRDLEREILVKRKLEEYQTLELKLKKTLEEMELREKKVLDFDEQLQRKEKLLVEENEQIKIEYNKQLQRLREDFDHKQLIDKQQRLDLEKRYSVLEKEAEELKLIIKERDSEVFKLKEGLMNHPDVKMQSDMNLLLIEKNKLEQKIETITKSKIHYKQQWARALRELARIKLVEQEAAKTRLKKQQQELDHLKVRYMAAEEKKIMKSERDEFKEVKDEIDKRLKELQLTVANNKNNDKKEKPCAISDEIDTQKKSRVAQLIVERDTLLQTGVYSLEDQLITELEKEIQDLLEVNT